MKVCHKKLHDLLHCAANVYQVESYRRANEKKKVINEEEK